MNTDVVDFASLLKAHEVSFKLFPNLWNDFSNRGISTNSLSWHEVKFLNDDGTNFHDDIQTLPANAGGIYLFIAKADVIPDVTSYLMYVGRAHFSQGQNLRKRCRNYFTKYLREQERPKIQRMIRQWGLHLHIRYCTVQDNDAINRLEAALIDALLPPFNDQIPNKQTRHAVQAFS